MGKESELWDDSALVKAFDDAISKYKKMHGKNKTSDEEKIMISSSEMNGSACDNQSHEPAREAEDTNKVVSNTKTKTGEAENLVPFTEDPCIDSHAPEPHIDSSNGLATQDAVKDYAVKEYSCSQGAEDYNQLLSQYYELEEKKQQILQQLHQFSSWNYQFSGEGSSSGAQWGAFNTSQEHAVPASQESHSRVVSSCCPYACQFLVAPCTTNPACSLGGKCTDKTCTEASAAVISQKPPSRGHADMIKTAMGAAEKALSSMKTKVSDNPEEVEEKRENESNSSETDLTVVLNAWYSAGFYTGKYLTEQSLAKNRHD